MITDDPETPGNGHWEINLGWTDQRTPGTTLMGLPLLDANYGIGDDFQLTYETPWAIVRDTDGIREGLGNTQLGAKWRFYNAGEHGWEASVFPQVTFLNPGLHADRRGLADADTTLLLPFEAEKNFDPWAWTSKWGMSSARSPARTAGWAESCLAIRSPRAGSWTPRRM